MTFLSQVTKILFCTTWGNGCGPLEHRLLIHIVYQGDSGPEIPMYHPNSQKLWKMKWMLGFGLLLYTYNTNIHGKRFLLLWVA